MRKTPQLTSDIYPNLYQDLRGGSVCSKSQWIFDNRHDIYDFMVDNLPSVNYRLMYMMVMICESLVLVSYERGFEQSLV